MITLNNRNYQTGQPEVDRYIITIFSNNPCDTAVFLQSPADTADLSSVGLHGALYEQLPEFVLSIPLNEGALYHAFVLYNNENGVHIFSLKGTLDDTSEEFLKREI